MSFRKFTLLVCLSFYALISKGQIYYEEVIYLKNGSVIHGVIIEQIPNISLKIKTNDGNIFVFKMDEIEKIAKELPVSYEKVRYKKSKTGQKENKAFFIGIKSGLNLTKFTNNSGYYEEKFIPRFQATLLISKCLTNVVSIQPEIQYSRQGFLLFGSSGNTNFKFNFITEYINFSPLIRFNLGENKTKFILFIGPYIGYWINEKTESFTNNIKVISVWNSSWSPYNRFEIGGSLGFGLSHSFDNNDQIIFDSKLSYGFNGILKNATSSNNSNNLYNSFSIGYLHKF